MNTLINRVNQNKTWVSAAVLIGGSTVLGIILGIIRTKLINANFNNFATGAYFAAFKIPDLIFYTLAAGALSVVFIPVLSDKIASAQRKEAWRLASSVLNLVSLIMLVVCLCLVIFPRPILEHIIVPGFSAERLDIAAQIMRLVAINPLIFSITSILSSIQQFFGRFFFFAIAPLFYNLSIIASIYIFKDSMGVIGLGVGVAIGALLNLFILGFGMNRLNFKHLWKINFKDRAFLQVMKALPLRSFDQSITYINSIIQTRIASTISIHAVTNFENALLLHNAPITLLGAALGTVAFPRFTKRLSQKRPDLFRKEFLDILKMMIWLAIPTVIITYFCRDFLSRFIFSRDNREIATILSWLSIGIFCRTLYVIISRFYYAQKDTLTPLLVTFLVLFSNIAFSWFLAKEYGVAGLGMAASIMAILEITILVLIIRLRHKNLFDINFLRTLILMGFSTLGVTLVAIGILRWLALQPQDANLEIFTKVGTISLAIFSTHFFLSYCLGITEAKRLAVYLKKAGLKRLQRPLKRK